MTALKGHKGAGGCAGSRGHEMPVSKAGFSPGFSMVELMVAVFIILFVALAMMQTAMMTMEANARNVLRDEGVRLAGDKLNGLRFVLEAELITKYDGSSSDENVHLRNMTVVYTVTNTVTLLAAKEAVKMKTVVEWTWRGVIYNSTLSTIRAVSNLQ